MKINFIEIIKNNYIFLLLFNISFILLILIFFNNIHSGYKFNINVKSYFIDKIADNFDIELKHYVKRYNSFHAVAHSLILNNIYNKDVYINIERKSSHEVNINFFTYNDEINEKKILDIFNQIYEESITKLNKNYIEVLNAHNKDIIINLNKLKNIFDTYPEIDVDQIFKEFDNYITGDRKLENKVPKIKYFSKTFIENNKIEEFYIFLKEFNNLILLEDLKNYLKHSSQNSVYDYKISIITKNNIYFKKFEYLYIIFSAFISFITSILFIIFKKNINFKINK